MSGDTVIGIVALWFASGSLTLISFDTREKLKDEFNYLKLAIVSLLVLLGPVGFALWFVYNYFIKGRPLF